MHTEYLDYTEGKTTCEGYLAYDPMIKGKRPAVIVCHAWAGQDDFARQKAEALAQLGYVGFALDMYGKGVRGGMIEQNAKLMKPFVDDRGLLARRINAAADAIRGHLMVDGNRLGAIGYCFGGMCALDLARTTPKGVIGVVSFHGLLGAPPKAAAKKITASVLALHGYDDPMATPDNLLAFAKEMSAAGADWQVHAYGHTVHAFTNPEANMPENGIVYNANADKRSWIAMKNFYEEIFG